MLRHILVLPTVSALLVYGIIIRPAVEVGWLDTLLAEQSGDLRTMIDGVVDGLDQDDDDRRLIAPTVKVNAGRADSVMTQVKKMS